MNLNDLINRVSTPDPWSEGDNIPWNDPGFSERMLLEHLSQDHDLASRKTDRIDQHIQWIHHHILAGKPSRILDLGCGPGLYSNRLARLGHQCVGIDYSPASIAYAKDAAKKDNLACTFQEADIRSADFRGAYDTVLLIYGELNVFKKADACSILEKAFHALKPGGRLILEPHTFVSIQECGEQLPTWYSSKSRLFSPNPHIVMEEYFWDSTLHITTNRYFIVDAATGGVKLYARSLQAYTRLDYEVLLGERGYTNLCFYPSLTGIDDPQQGAMFALLATKP